MRAHCGKNDNRLNNPGERRGFGEGRLQRAPRDTARRLHAKRFVRVSMGLGKVGAQGCAQLVEVVTAVAVPDRQRRTQKVLTVAVRSLNVPKNPPWCWIGPCHKQSCVGHLSCHQTGATSQSCAHPAPELCPHTGTLRPQSGLSVATGPLAITMHNLLLPGCPQSIISGAPAGEQSQISDQFGFRWFGGSICEL